MRPSQSAEALKAHMCAMAGDLGRAPLYDLISAVLSFYADQPAEGLAPDEDSDMLVFQYGSYDWGEGEMFEFDITRQFVAADKRGPDAITQLRMTAYFAADAELRALSRESLRCGSRDDLARFRATVFSSPAFAMASLRAPAKVEIGLESY